MQETFRLKRCQGLIFILSAPSGCGKTTIAKRLFEQDLLLQPSISVNTRPKRAEETDGVDYFFVTLEQFQQWEREGRFVETVKIYDTYRGTLKSFLQKNCDKGVDTLCVVDWHGAHALSAAFPGQTVSIFLLPPNLQILKERLIGRGQDNLEEIDKRLQQALEECQHFVQYDYCLINHNVEATLTIVQSIINAERCRTVRQALNS